VHGADGRPGPAAQSPPTARAPSCTPTATLV